MAALFHVKNMFKMKILPVAASLCAAYFSMAVAFAQLPETVRFDSADGKVKLAAYLYLPDAKRWPAPRPAIVMLHGRSGVFSAGAKKFDATTLAGRTVSSIVTGRRASAAIPFPLTGGR